jgi:hypothetical protein
MTATTAYSEISGVSGYLPTYTKGFGAVDLSNETYGVVIPPSAVTTGLKKDRWAIYRTMGSLRDTWQHPGLPVIVDNYGDLYWYYEDKVSPYGLTPHGQVPLSDRLITSIKQLTFTTLVNCDSGNGRGGVTIDGIDILLHSYRAQAHTEYALYRHIHSPPDPTLVSWLTTLQDKIAPLSIRLFDLQKELTALSAKTVVTASPDQALLERIAALEKKSSITPPPAVDPAILERLTQMEKRIAVLSVALKEETAKTAALQAELRTHRSATLPPEIDLLDLQNDSSVVIPTLTVSEIVST